MPGFGESTRDPDNDHGIDAQVERLAAFLDTLGFERCHLGGNSLGGYVALAFALKYPERMHSLSLFNNAGVNGPERSALQLTMARGENPLRLQSTRDVVRILSQIIYHPPYIPLLVKHFILSENRRRGDLLDRIFGEVIEDALNGPLDDQLSKLHVPTIIFWGRHDKLLDVSAAAFQHERISGSRLVVFDDVGHEPMIERPWSTAIHHRSFLAGVGRN